MTRGSRIHDECERYIKGESDDLPAEMQAHFREHLDIARELYSQKRAEGEQLWAFTEDWQPLPKGAFGYWHIKVDLCFHLNPAHVVIVDYKTGKLSPWNRIKHTQQGQLYLIASFRRFEEAEKGTSEFWYPDMKGGHVEPMELSRRAATVVARRWIERAKRMTEATVFPPNPSNQICRFCPYSKANGSGVCGYASM